MYVTPNTPKVRIEPTTYLSQVRHPIVENWPTTNFVIVNELICVLVVLSESERDG